MISPVVHIGAIAVSFLFEGDLGKKISEKIFPCYLRVVLCPVSLLFFRLLVSCAFTFSLHYFFGGGFMAMAAHPPTNGASSSFVESSGEIDALMDTTRESAYSEDEDTSVNQEFVEEEQRAQQAKLRELEELILEQYQAFICKEYSWMHNSILLPNMKGGVVEGVMKQLELETYSSSDLTDWLNSLRAKPTTLYYFFQDSVPRRK
jgi:hypothetical protein